MKTNLIKSMLAVFTLLLVVGLSSCEKGGPVDTDMLPESMSSSSNASVADITDSDFTLDAEAMPYEVSDPTLNSEMGFHPRDDRGRHDKGRKDRGPRDRGPKKDRGINFGRIFYAMQLTEDQATEIREYFIEFHDCRKELFQATLDDRKAILEEANAQRREIIAAYQAGDMTREEVRDAMRELGKETREKMKALVDVDAHCACILELIAKIESQLTDEQLELWNKWKENLKGPCFDDENTNE